MNKFLVTTAIVCTAGLSSFSASAQSLNYGMMQEMFGEPVTTSANGSPMRASEVPLDMTIITAEEIARFPAREIPDILRNYAGVSVRQSGLNDYAVGMRGFNQGSSERILVLVNGRQVYEDYYGVVSWDTIPVQLNEIRQIEIVRGPNTALFGFNAVSGVVNVVTKNPLYDDVDYVEADFGNNSYVRGAGAYTWQGDVWAGRFSYENMAAEEDDNSTYAYQNSFAVEDPESKAFSADVAAQLDSSTQMRFEIASSLSDTNVNALSGRPVGVDDHEFDSMKVSLSSDTDYGIIDAAFYHNSISVDQLAQPGAVIGFRNDVTVAQLSDTFKVGTDHTFRLAGEFRNNQTEHITAGLNFGNSILNIKSFSSLWYWNINEKMSLSVAGRYDHVRSDFDDIFAPVFAANPYGESAYNNTYDEFGYNLGYVYKPTDVDTLRLSMAKGIDLPSPVEIAIQAPGSTYGNPHIEASDVHDIQLGYERNLVDWNSNFKATAFYQRVNEVQGLGAVTGFVAPVQANNLGDYEVHGFELSLKGVADNGIRWGANYSYSDVEDDEGRSSDFDAMNTDHTFNMNVGYSPNDEWDYDLFGTYTSSFDDERFTSVTTPAIVEVDSEVIFDARIGYKPESIEGLSVSLNGQSVFGGNEQTAYGEEVPSQVFLRIKYDL